MDYRKAILNIREQLAIYITENKLGSLVIGISGGMDSCLCAALAKPVCDELNIPLIGRSLPMESNKPDEIERAKLTGKVFCNVFDEVNLSKFYNPLQDWLIGQISPLASPELIKSYKIHNGNIKARLRMMYLYNLASEQKGMILSTDNYTEYLLGFWTLHGDVGDYGMIQNLWKTEVYDMAEWLGDNEYLHKPAEAYKTIRMTIDALATDGLGVSSLGDLGQILPDWKGNSRDGYREVDQILEDYLSYIKICRSTSKDMEKLNIMESHPVIRRHLGTEFKRIIPVNIPRTVIFYGPSAGIK
jgi:NAD+ synthetase